MNVTRHLNASMKEIFFIRVLAKKWCDIEIKERTVRFVVNSFYPFPPTCFIRSLKTAGGIFENSQTGYLVTIVANTSRRREFLFYYGGSGTKNCLLLLCTQG